MNLWQKFVVTIVRDSIITERNISNGQVKEVVRSFEVFKPLNVNVRVGIELPSNLPRCLIEFHSRKRCLVAQMSGNQSQEVATAH